MSSVSRNEGGESPPPETQTGKQLHDVPASGVGTDEAPNKKESMENQLKNLTSNPEGGAFEAAREAKFSKSMADKPSEPK
ncbi:hypothetical protein F5X96DRAFT_671819 [Biscogniauxia mediterranea]|nr:hypothetical protein F5X96DRAFT_671819 [Biscogniauxia mediterranea]